MIFYAQLQDALLEVFGFYLRDLHTKNNVYSENEFLLTNKKASLCNHVYRGQVKEE